MRAGLDYQKADGGSSVGGWRIHRPLSRRERVIVDLFPHAARGDATGFDQRDAAQVCFRLTITLTPSSQPSPSP